MLFYCVLHCVTIMLFNPTRYSEQFKIVKNLNKVKNISQVIIDSFTHYYRKKLHEKVVINPATIRMLKMLQDLDVPVILTSQVYSFDGKVSPVASDLFRRFVSYKIFLELDKDRNKRNLKIKDEKLEVPFIIEEKGLIV